MQKGGEVSVFTFNEYHFETTTVFTSYNKHKIYGLNIFTVPKEKQTFFKCCLLLFTMLPPRMAKLISLLYHLKFCALVGYYEHR